jgi:murein DD-endopeptidase MepM/ murein hydrolase activator NlpD
MKYVGVMGENILRCVTNSKDKLEHSNLPYCGDPLVEMRIVGTDENDKNNHIGGLYGCVRYTNKQSEQNCEEWVANITNFPSISDKNKVHDGIDLYAALNTPLYSAYDGVVEAVYNNSTSDLGNYLIIKSTKSEHLLSNEESTLFIAYSHLQSIFLKKGDIIKQGQLIGYTGNSGNASSIDSWRHHVHLQVYRINNSNKYNRVNPIDYITTKFNKNNGNKIN